jgi:hypothetical protein
VSAQERPGARDTFQASRRSLGITARGVERKIQSASLGSCTGNGGGKTSTGQDRREEGGGGGTKQGTGVRGARWMPH